MASKMGGMDICTMLISIGTPLVIDIDMASQIPKNSNLDGNPIMTHPQAP